MGNIIIFLIFGVPLLIVFLATGHLMVAICTILFCIVLAMVTFAVLSGIGRPWPSKLIDAIMVIVGLVAFVIHPMAGLGVAVLFCFVKVCL